MNCTIINNLNLIKSFKNKSYNYIVIDTNSLTIVPYLKSDKYVTNDRIIITPFMETFKLYLNYKKIFPHAKFIFVFDGGISPTIFKLFPDYKKNRRSRKYTSTTTANLTGNKVYDYNIQLLNILFGYFNEVSICDINRNESDFIIGYIIDKLSIESKCLVMSHDRDLLFSYDKNNNVDVFYKQTGTSDQRVTNFLIESQDCINHIFDFQYLKNIKELLYYRALIGDTSDGIPKPFGIKSKVIVDNMFKDTFMMDNEVTYDYIVEYFKIKFKGMNPVVFERFQEDLRKNIAVMNIFNSDIISDTEKIKLNSYIDEIQYDVNGKIEINSIYELFEKYGLYLTKEDLDKTFKYLKGI